MPSIATGSIRRLSPETASRIAAGEVIERPLSALKEILENASDAGSRRIEVRVEGSLDQSFQVADDGCGIAPDELEIALERHATSKISTLEDLDRLASLGFRGEALPSIAAVSRMRITSRPAGGEGEAAAFIAIDGGTVTVRGAAARAPGTTVEVRDLFHNTPARRKFLHSQASEMRAALRLLEALGLAYPQISFRLVVDGKERFDWPAAQAEGLEGARERAASLWGPRHADQRIAVTVQRGGLTLQALLGLPEHARATRDGQVVFVNRRWIQSPLIGHAMRQAYGDLLPHGRFPAAALWITSPPDRLDVNVHPTKREVRFADDDAVFALVAGACAQHLAHLHPPFTVVYGTTPEPRWAGRVEERPSDQVPLALVPSSSPPVPIPSTVAPSAGTSASEPELWQLHRTYILAPVRGGLVIVDQHAAHERILYEEALARLQGEQGQSQQLLFPALVDLPRDRFELLLELGPSLRHLGWDLTLLGPPTVVIQGIPAGLAHERPAELLRDILDGMADDRSDPAASVMERFARSFACHAAVKAGMGLSPEEMRTLVDRLFATTKPHGDPHGRPTFVRLELDDLHRRFGRS